MICKIYIIVDGISIVVFVRIRYNGYNERRIVAPSVGGGFGKGQV